MTSGPSDHGCKQHMSCLCAHAVAVAGNFRRTQSWSIAEGEPQHFRQSIHKRKFQEVGTRWHLPCKLAFHRPTPGSGFGISCNEDRALVLDYDYKPASGGCCCRKKISWVVDVVCTWEAQPMSPTWAAFLACFSTSCSSSAVPMPSNLTSYPHLSARSVDHSWNSLLDLKPSITRHQGYLNCGNAMPQQPLILAWS